MILRKVYNSSGKEIGELHIYNDKIEFINKKKGNLTIEDSKIIDCAKNCLYNEDIIKELYDNYTLLIGEIAAVFDVLYCKANKWTKILGTTGRSAGRRNASYNLTFSANRKNKMSKSRQLFFENGGKNSTYVRTPEIKKKISDGVKKAQLEGRLPNPREVALKAWRDGKYNTANFKRGIGGYFTSIKIDKRFFFRSLLELFYLIKLENDDSVISYKYEELRIHCEDGTTYTPDLIVNDNTVIELKSYNFVYKQGGSIQEKFEYKCDQGKRYCLEHGLTYKVIFDKDLGFDSESFKHILKESDYIKKYSIEFLQPERVWSRK